MNMQIAAARAHYNSGGARNSLPGAGLPTEQGAASREAGLDSLVEPETRPAPPRPAPRPGPARPTGKGGLGAAARPRSCLGTPAGAARDGRRGRAPWASALSARLGQ